MSKTILAVVKLQKNVELLLQRLKSAVKPGNRIVFLFEYQHDVPTWLLAQVTAVQTGFDNGLAWQEQKAWLSWDDQKHGRRKLSANPRAGYSADRRGGGGGSLFWEGVAHIGLVPAHFVVLDSLPLNPSGKVDYRALPPIRSSSASAATEPRNDIEVKLQAIFADVLGCWDIGIDDNFFRMGGHSLLAARAAARIGDAFGVGLALSTFLESPTVAGLAAKIASLLPTGQSASESDKDEREDFEV